MAMHLVRWWPTNTDSSNQHAPAYYSVPSSCPRATAPLKLREKSNPHASNLHLHHVFFLETIQSSADPLMHVNHQTLCIIAMH